MVENEDGSKKRKVKNDGEKRHWGRQKGTVDRRMLNAALRHFTESQSHMETTLSNYIVQNPEWLAGQLEKSPELMRQFIHDNAEVVAAYAQKHAGLFMGELMKQLAQDAERDVEK